MTAVPYLVALALCFLSCAAISHRTRRAYVFMVLSLVLLLFAMTAFLIGLVVGGMEPTP